MQCNSVLTAVLSESQFPISPILPHFFCSHLFSLSQSPNCLIIFFSISILHIFSSCFFMLLLPLWMKLKLIFPAVSFLICSLCFLPVILTSFFHLLSLL